MKRALSLGGVVAPEPVEESDADRKRRLKDAIKAAMEEIAQIDPADEMLAPPVPVGYSTLSQAQYFGGVTTNFLSTTSVLVSYCSPPVSDAVSLLSVVSAPLAVHFGVVTCSRCGLTQERRATSNKCRRWTCRRVLPAQDDLLLSG